VNLEVLFWEEAYTRKISTKEIAYDLGDKEKHPKFSWEILIRLTDKTGRKVRQTDHNQPIYNQSIYRFTINT